MLDQTLVPGMLIEPGQRPAIRIDPRATSAQHRVPFLLLHMLSLGGRVLWLKLTGKLDGTTLGRMLTEFCQRMGVLWIKVGQVISMRADVASVEVRAELAKLTDRAYGFPPDIAKRLVEDALGAPLERVFSDFYDVPIAAASISQVHRARLRHEQAWVAVKIRRPNVVAICAADLATLRAIVRVIEWLSILPHGRWRDALWEIEESMHEELDYRFEATNMRRIRRTLRRHNVYVPRVFSALSTEGVLVMEYIRGVLMSDYLQVHRTDPQKLKTWLTENNVDPALVARRLLHSLLRQALEDNLFHCDLHPGNIVLLRDSRIAFIDFGTVASTELDFLRKFDLHTEAMGAKQYSKMVDIFFLFSQSLPARDLTDLKDVMIRRLQTWESRSRVRAIPYSEKSINILLDDLVLTAARYGVALVWSFFRLTRALTTVDASLRDLYPEGNFQQIVAQYYRLRELRDRRRMARQPPVDAEDVRALLDMPTTLSEYAMYRATVVRRASRVFEGTASNVATFIARIFGFLARALLGSSLLLLAFLVYQSNPSWFAARVGSTLGEILRAAPKLDPQVWILAICFLVYGYRLFAKLRKRFQEAEARIPAP